MPAVVWKGKSALFTAGVNTTLVELPTSPIYEFSDSAKCTRTYRGLHSLCISSMPGINTVGTGDMAGWIVTNVKISRQPKQIGELVVTWGVSTSGGSGTGLVLPIDEVGLVPFEINPKIESNPFFSALTDDDRARVRAWIDASDPSTRAINKAVITGTTNETLELSLGAKLLKGIETYYLVGWTYTWTSYSFDYPSAMDGGGHIDTPGGPLASLVTSNPAIVWMRQADSMDPAGKGPYKITKTWLGAANGHWDSDLY